ncbi:hypothetical protein [Mesorhizobium sp. M0118]|uniref:hypothetical protein n=1 Tax=Mesorhizobium sp. M0118 TaxID=2956884 RepID=UPI0033352511
MGAPIFNLSGFHPAARMLARAGGAAIEVEIVDVAICALQEVVYAWVDNQGAALRIGTSRSAVRRRLLSYSTYINRSLAGEGGATPEWEAKEWLKLCNDCGELCVFVHHPAVIETTAGPIRPYLDIERVLIRRYKPRLNRSHR